MCAWPLKHETDLRLKLNWEELQHVWETLGYKFLSTTQVNPRPQTLNPGALKP